MDKTAIKDNSNPTSKRFNGLHSNIIKAVNARVLSENLLRPNISFTEQILSIVAERTTDGAMPTSIVKDHIDIRMMICPKIFFCFLNVKIVSMLYIMPRCSPDNANTCEAPVIEYMSLVCLDRVDLSPSVMAAIMEYTCPLKLCALYLDNKRCLNLMAANSVRWSSDRFVRLILFCFQSL